MNSTEIENELKELIVERLFLDIEPAEIQASMPLAEYGIDSFLLVEVIVAMEETFDVRIEPADINTDTLNSISSLRDLIETKKAG